MGRMFLLMAKFESTKTLAKSEIPAQWTKFKEPDAFAPGKGRYAGDEVYDKISQLAWKNRDSKPGFAIVDEKILPEAADAKDVVVIGPVDNIAHIKVGKPEEVTPPPPEEVVEDTPESVEKVMPVAEEETEPLECPHCPRKFNDVQSLADHLEWHKEQKAKFAAAQAKREQVSKGASKKHK